MQGFCFLAVCLVQREGDVLTSQWGSFLQPAGCRLGLQLEPFGHSGRLLLLRDLEIMAMAFDVAFRQLPWGIKRPNG